MSVDRERFDNERNPHAQLRGNVFPSAFQARGLTGSIYWGDAGDGEHPLSPPLSYNIQAQGQDTAYNGPVGPQWGGAWGMEDARHSFRNRFFNTINLGKLVRSRWAALDGRSDMRPSAIAIHPRVFGENQPVVSGHPFRNRWVARGTVTRWEQSSMEWPKFGGK